MSQGKAIELILNGDVFDFDSVTSLPQHPLFRISKIEKMRGLFPTEERSLYKIQRILSDHPVFTKELARFISHGNRVVFVLGNHDLELHFPLVQEEILKSLELPDEARSRVRFVEWFYISNKDTLVEHGNQYDPYCVCEDPINPFIRGYSTDQLKLPFGNLACRYILNGMGFFNPHVDSNYIMGVKEYVNIFLRYMARAQPFIVLDWLFGALVTLYYSFKERLAVPLRNPYTIEDKIERIAKKANATPRMVREMKELIAEPAASRPFLLMRELWLDRFFLISVSFLIIIQAMVIIRSVYHISFFWALIPLAIFAPFFLFYSNSVSSLVSGYKEPDDRVMAMASSITKVQRIVFGHTHLIRHEMIGFVEHLNSGCWSPAFLDVECTKPLDQKTFIWISPDVISTSRKAEVFRYNGKVASPLHQSISQKSKASTL
jgi:UDP-2,3-diacylglucosamine pyrophosphatase LpxH